MGRSSRAKRGTAATVVGQPIVLYPAPDISYIVSAYNRPWMLPVCLWSLAGQLHKNFEVIVADNADNEHIARQHETAVNQVRAFDPGFHKRFHYKRTGKLIKVNDCWNAAEWVIKNMARGAWYAFPCDDSYYVPEFGQRMLGAAYSNNWDFVICGNMVVGPDASGGSGYRVWRMSIGRTIKTSFMVKASLFRGFEGKPDIPSPVAVDYFFGHRIRERGISYGWVDEVMVVHN